jgi:shikimate dehydrogenase
LRVIDKESKLFALLDDMAGNSPRPKEFNSIFASSNLNASYLPLNIREDDILFTINGLKNSQISGVNLGKKYRKDALNLLDFSTDEVRESGFVNSIKIQNGKLHGYITIGEAIASLIEREKIAIFGSGSLAKSIIWNISDRKKVTVVEKSIENTLEISQKFPEVNIKFSDENHLFEVSENMVLIDATDGEKLFINFKKSGFQTIFLDENSSLFELGDISTVSKVRDCENLIDLREWL